MPIPRNATFVCPGAATTGAGEAAAAAAAETEEEEADRRVDLRLMPRPRLSLSELCARVPGLISMERAERDVAKARPGAGEEQRRGATEEREAAARSVSVVDLLLEEEVEPTAAARGGGAEERSSMVFSSVPASDEEFRDRRSAFLSFFLS